MRRLLAVLPALALLAGCASVASVSGGDVPAATSPVPVASAPISAGSCKADVRFDSAGAFEWLGRRYAPVGQTTLKNKDTGGLLFSVGCDRSMAYSVKGRRTECELLVFNTDAFDAYAPTPLSTACPAPVLSADGRTAALPSPATAPEVTGAFGTCPSPAPTESGHAMAIDYVDFLQAGGRFYQGDLADRSAASPKDNDRGEPQLTIRCTVSTWSDTYQQGLTNQDGDASFLPAGTQVYAVKGHSPSCQLMARTQRGWDLFISTAGGCPSPPAAPS
jgi:hypothetical protein